MLENLQIAMEGHVWLKFMYEDYKYYPEDPLKGFLRSDVIVKASVVPTTVSALNLHLQLGSHRDLCLSGSRQRRETRFPEAG